MEYAQAEVEVEWSEQGSMGSFYEKQAVFLIDGYEDTTEAGWVALAEQRAEEQVGHRVFIEILGAKFKEAWLITQLYFQRTHEEMI